MPHLCLSAHRSAAPGGAAVTALLDAADVARVLKRLAHELVEREEGADELVLLGIQTRGVPLADRLAAWCPTSRAPRSRSGRST